jgi:ABC-2 type transport system permease protein
MSSVPVTIEPDRGLGHDPGVGERLRWQLADSLVFAGRNLAHVRQIPEKLIDVTLQPLMFVLLFAYVFGGVIHVPGGNYHSYLIGGILVQTLAFGMMGPATSIASDLTEGIVDRFRSLPSSRFAYLAGHLIAELSAATLGLTVLTASGLVVGWRIDSDLPHALAGFVLLLAIAAAMLCLGTLLGLCVRSVDAVQGVVFLAVFPLTFIASTFVPIGGLPAGLRAVAEYNPVSIFAAAVRKLFGNPTAIPASSAWPMHHAVLASVIWCAGLLAIAVPLTVVRFRALTRG